MSLRREAGRCLDRDATFAIAAPSFDPLSSFAGSLKMQHALWLGVSSTKLLSANVSDEIFFGRAVVPSGDLVQCDQITNIDSRGLPSSDLRIRNKSLPRRKKLCATCFFAFFE